MSIIVLIIASVLFAFLGLSLWLWSRWAERGAAYEPEQLGEEEGNLYRLGIALGADHGFHGGQG